MQTASEIRIIRVALSEIIADDEIQARAATDENLISDYEELLRNGTDLGPGKALWDEENKVYWLYDGFHRYKAHKRLGLPTMALLVEDGTKEDAMWKAAGENDAHGLRRTNADKEKSARRVVKMHPERSDDLLASHAKVSRFTIAKFRKLMEENNEVQKQKTRTGKDGKQRSTKATTKEKPNLLNQDENNPKNLRVASNSKTENLLNSNQDKELEKTEEIQQSPPKTDKGQGISFVPQSPHEKIQLLETLLSSFSKEEQYNLLFSQLNKLGIKLQPKSNESKPTYLRRLIYESEDLETYERRANKFDGKTLSRLLDDLEESRSD